MKKLFVHILITICFFFLFDRLFGIGMKYLYGQSNATDEYKISYSCEKTFDSVLFMGSSRSLHHYVPSIFEKELDLTCYNAGDWGIKNIYFQYGMLSNILSRYNPKIIVLDVHPSDWLQYPYSGKERAGSLAPYCGMSDGCDEMLKLSGKYWAYRLSVVYRYTGSLPSLLAGKFGNMDRSLKGWKPLDGEMDPTNVITEEFEFPIDSDRVRLLERFITDCQTRNIRLIIAVSPMYSCSKKDVFSKAAELSRKYKIRYLDHYRDSVFEGHCEFFYDFGHLNRRGAELYSQIIAKELLGSDSILNAERH